MKKILKSICALLAFCTVGVCLTACDIWKESSSSAVEQGSYTSEVETSSTTEGEDSSIEEETKQYISNELIFLCGEPVYVLAEYNLQGNLIGEYYFLYCMPTENYRFEYVYDEAGYVVEITVFCDVLGLNAEKEHYQLTLDDNGVSVSEDGDTSIEYHANGKIKKRIYDGWWITEYDEYGRRVCEDEEEGSYRLNYEADSRYPISASIEYDGVIAEFMYTYTNGLLSLAEAVVGETKVGISFAYGEERNITITQTEGYADEPEPTYVETYQLSCNEQGKLTEYSNINHQGILVHSAELEYDEDGNFINGRVMHFNPKSFFGSSKTELELVASANGEGYTSKEVCTHYNEDGSFNSMYEYEYNENGDEIKFTSYNEDGSVSSYRTSERVYDENSYIIKRIDTDYLGDDSIRSVGVYEYQRNEAGKELKETYMQYNADGSVSGSYIYEYEYNENGNEVKEVRTNYNADGSVSGSYIYEYEYDENGNTLKDTTTQYSASGCVSYSISCEYEDGRRIKSTFTRYNEGGSISSTDVTEYKWVIEHKEDGNGWTGTAYEVRNAVTYYKTDGSVKDYYVKEWKRDDKGDILKEEKTYYNADGSMEDYYLTYWWTEEYDKQGRIIIKARVNPNESMPDYVYEYEYNEYGAIIKEVKTVYKTASGQVQSIVEREYDDNGNKIQETNYNSLSRKEDSYEWVYDNEGNLIKEVYKFYDDDNLEYDVNEQEYNKDGECVKYSFYEVSSDGSKTYYFSYNYEYEVEYDENENIVKQITEMYSEGTLIQYIVYECEYDMSGNEIRRIMEVYTYNTMQYYYICEWDYNANGDIIYVEETRYTSNDDIIQHYRQSREYGEDGEEITRTTIYYSSDGTINNYYVTSYMYDAEGTKGGVCIEYNANGNVISREEFIS